MYPHLDPIVSVPGHHTLDVHRYRNELNHIVLDILVFSATMHRAIQKQVNHSQVQYDTTVLEHRSLAFGKLNQELQHPQRQLQDMTLVSVLVLMLAGVGSPRVHCRVT